MFYQRAESLRLDGLEAARRFFAGLLAESDPMREHLWIAHVDDAARCVHLSRHDGAETGATVPLRQILVDAALHGSSGLLLAHNHPSGDATPSAEDCAVTRRLSLVGEAMDLTVVDHLVIAGTDYRSMRAMGLL
ncbi:JAB domain-containing protein [Sphingomonas mesophila]|uniref:JAB domain-containing protein n=1 Tax=Sphingomonas mesophila TaxID=2303576 RepID=UPI000E56BE27|nr:JAB domain-containing protein [Sphingomonas mesophila]